MREKTTPSNISTKENVLALVNEVSKDVAGVSRG